MKRALALVFACLALGLVVAGCGGDDDDGDGGGGGGAETAEQPADGGGGGGNGGGSGGGGGAEISMQDIKFQPGTVTVTAGDTVTWTNDDSVGHDVTGDDFESGEPGGMQNGDTYKHAFDEPGTFDYVCQVHPGMEGTVTVK